MSMEEMVNKMHTTSTSTVVAPAGVTNMSFSASLERFMFLQPQKKLHPTISFQKKIYL
jgi:hypothetical protein